MNNAASTRRVTEPRSVVPFDPSPRVGLADGKRTMKSPRKGSLAWYQKIWEEHVAVTDGTGDLPKLLGYLSYQLAQSSKTMARERMRDEAMRRLAQEVRDLTVGYRMLSSRFDAIMKRLGLTEPSPKFPVLGKDGMVVVNGTPHLPDCDVVRRRMVRGKKLVPVTTCSCGSVGTREKWDVN